MNNVLASISSFAELLGDRASTEQRDDIAQIIGQSRRGAELTRGLLAFSRRGLPHAGDPAPHAAPSEA